MIETIKNEEKKKHQGKHFSSEYQPEKNGRPKGSLSLRQIIKEVWGQDVGTKASPKIRAIKSVEALIKKAEKGDVKAFKALSDRFEGMPTQRIEQIADVVVQMPQVKIDDKKLEIDLE